MFENRKGTMVRSNADDYDTGRVCHVLGFILLFDIYFNQLNFFFGLRKNKLTLDGILQ